MELQNCNCISRFTFFLKEILLWVTLCAIEWVFFHFHIKNPLYLHLRNWNSICKSKKHFDFLSYSFFFAFSDRCNCQKTEHYCPVGIYLVEFFLAWVFVYNVKAMCLWPHIFISFIILAILSFAFLKIASYQAHTNTADFVEYQHCIKCYE